MSRRDVSVMGVIGSPWGERGGGEGINHFSFVSILNLVYFFTALFFLYFSERKDQNSRERGKGKGKGRGRGREMGVKFRFFTLLFFQGGFVRDVNRQPRIYQKPQCMLNRASG